METTLFITIPILGMLYNITVLQVISLIAHTPMQENTEKNVVFIINTDVQFACCLNFDFFDVTAMKVPQTTVPQAKIENDDKYIINIEIFHVKEQKEKRPLYTSSHSLGSLTCRSNVEGDTCKSRNEGGGKGKWFDWEAQTKEFGDSRDSGGGDMGNMGETGGTNCCC